MGTEMDKQANDDRPEPLNRHGDDRAQDQLRAWPMTRRYLPGLNGLRFVGAFVVLVSHVEELKRYFGFRPQPGLQFWGKIGVVLFFALSGFLITYLLLVERATRGGISLKEFYARRALRIWPLYFLIVVLSLLCFSRIGGFSFAGAQNLYDRLTTLDVAFLFLVLPNLASTTLPYAGQIWSIGIEEQFYLLQPLAIKVLPGAPFVITLLAIVFSKEGFSLVQPALHRCADAGSVACVVGLRLGNGAAYYGCIAIGCLSCLLVYYERRRVLSFLFRRETQVAVLGLLASFLYLAYRNGRESYIDFRLYAVLFSVLVLNVSHNPRSLLKLETRPLRFLGEISYGLYMYHPVCIGLALWLVRAAVANRYPRAANLAIYLIAFTTTVLVSKISYDYFESPIRRLKRTEAGDRMEREQPHDARHNSNPAVMGEGLS